MSDIISICNSALFKIGANQIMALTDGTKEANACSIRYEDCKRAVLRSHPWSCATKRVILSPDTVQPAFGYTYAFQLPADFLRVIKVNPETQDDYKIDGTKLLGDFTELQLKYIYDVADASQFDSLLVEAIACYLAWDISYNITQSFQVKDMMNKDKDKALSKAKLADSQQMPSPEVEANEFLDARLGPVASNITQRRNW